MPKVLVIYHSQEYGNTEEVAKLVAQGLQKAGSLDVEMVNINVERAYDTEKLLIYDGVAIGSPDYGSTVAGTIKQLFDDLFVLGRQGKPVPKTPCVTFMTHGGGGKGAASLQGMAERRGFKVLAPVFTCEGAPDRGCPEAVELGELLGKAVLG